MRHDKSSDCSSEIKHALSVYTQACSHSTSFSHKTTNKIVHSRPWKFHCRLSSGTKAFFEAVFSADPFAIHQACLQWAHSILNPQPLTVRLCFPSTPPQSVDHPAPLTTTAPPAQSHSQPGILQQPSPSQAGGPCQLQPQSLMCQVVSEVAQLSSLLTHPQVCPCHGVPVQQLLPGGLQQRHACALSGQCCTAAQLKQNTNMVQVNVQAGAGVSSFC